MCTSPLTKPDHVYLLEVNPRASRTIPFVSKATGFPLAKIAARVAAGESLKSMNITRDFDLDVKTYNVKAPVFPFSKFPNVDTLLGPEMKSTGEVMGRATTFAGAYAKAMWAAGMQVPSKGSVFLSIRDEDKAEIFAIARGLAELGFEIVSTHGTAEFLRRNGIDSVSINKVHQGSPHCVEAIRDGRFSFIINTTSDEIAIRDSFSIRRAALERKTPYVTVLSAAWAMLEAIREERKGPIPVLPL
jgi:carbamoyl-phosphate synthase large subunit